VSKVGDFNPNGASSVSESTPPIAFFRQHPQPTAAGASKARE